LGVSRDWRPNNAEDTSGTPGYMAPEVITKTNHSFAVDFFALGVIAYELMLGKVRMSINLETISRQKSPVNSITDVGSASKDR